MLGKRLAEAGENTGKALIIRRAPTTSAQTGSQRVPDIVTDSWEITRSGYSDSLCDLSSSSLSKIAIARGQVSTKAVYLRPNFSPISRGKDRSDATSTTSDASTPASSTFLSPIIEVVHPGLSMIPGSTLAIPPSPCDQQHLKAPRIDFMVALGVCGSLLGLVCGHVMLRSSRQPPSVPDILHPTPLQLTTPHYSWIDRLPFPRMRDNLILLAHTINIEELFKDFFDTETFTVKEGGLPWDPTAWRMSPEFRAKWGYLLH